MSENKVPDELHRRYNLSETVSKPAQSIELQNEKRVKHLQQVKIERFLAGTPKQRTSSQTINSKMDSYTGFIQRASPDLLKGLEETTISSIEKQIMLEQTLSRQRIAANRFFGPVLGQIMRGKLGIDNVFLAFGFLGLIAIPFYFSRKFTQRRKRMEELPLRSKDLDERSRDVTFFDVEVVKQKIIEREKTRAEIEKLKRALKE